MSVFLLVVAASASLLSADASLDLKERPVAKVVGLLKDMQTQLGNEKEADQELYDKLSCWCSTNGDAKTMAIATAEKRIDSLSSDIQMFTAKGHELDATLASLSEEIEENTEALSKASAMRAKDLADFNADEKDLISSISSLKGAVTALGAQNSFLQTGSTTFQVKDLKHVLAKASPSLSADQRTVVQTFIQAPFSSYASNSGPIFGILSQMKETFETNLADAQKEEATAAADFSDLKAAKTTELNAAKQMVSSKTQERADAAESLAAATQDKKDTEAALAADTTFLRDLKIRCANADAEFEERTKARATELEGVADAIAILNDDASHELFANTLSFVETKSSTKRTAASSKLQLAARRTGSTELLAMAARVQNDAFDAVHKAMDDMISEMNVQQEDEVKHKDFCVAELLENGNQQAYNQDTLNDLVTDLATLQSTLEQLTKDLAAAKAEVEDTKVASTRASEDRELENKDFQQVVADQRATQQILQRALVRLQEVYGESLVQTKGPSTEPGAEADAAPEGFSEYKQSSSSGGVLGLLKEVIGDSKAAEMEAIKCETESHAAYEEYVKNANESIIALTNEITDKSEKKAATEARIVEASSDQTHATRAAEGLATHAATLHKACDFVTDNFTARQDARSSEIEALRQAKDILMGA